MKKFVVIVILFGCTSSYAGFLYTLKQVSFFYGKTFYYQGTNFHTLELQYDSKKSGCKGAKPYFGAGLVYGFNQNQEILGVKGMFTPPRINLPITRKSKIHPYVFVQGNLVRTNTDFTNTVHHVVPGLGLNGLYQFSSNLVLRPQFQVGYNWNKQFVSESNGWVIEAKLGIGLNTNLFKRKKKEI